MFNVSFDLIEETLGESRVHSACIHRNTYGEKPGRFGNRIYCVSTA